MRVGTKVQSGASLAEVAATWEAAESAGFELLSRWDHISARGVEGADTPSVLAFMAASTKTVRIASHVLNASLRNPILLASQLALIQAFSKGRLEVGLGAGGSRAFISADHEMTGIPVPSFTKRVRRLEAFCRILPRLWRGEEVSDETLGITNASLGELNIDPPPIIVGGMSDSILKAAARLGDGWNASVLDPEQFKAMSRRLDELRAQVGSERPFDKQVQLLQTEDLLPRLKIMLEQFREAGATTAIVGLPGPFGVERVYRLAEAVF